MQVDELIAAQQLDLTEDEYALLIGVCAHGATWERAEGVLRRMARELTTLQEGTLAAVERYFRHAAKISLTPSFLWTWSWESEFRGGLQTWDTILGWFSS